MIKVKEIRRRNYEVKLDEEAQQGLEFVAKLVDSDAAITIGGIVSMFTKFITTKLEKER